MKWIRCAIVVALWFLHSSYAFAYERDTHRELSKVTIDSSALSSTTNNILLDFGLNADISRNSLQRFPNSEGEQQSIIELVQDGADFEDDFSFLLPRPIHHFYDPINDQSLQHPLLNIIGGASRSPDWALEDTGDISSQNYSYKDALNAFYQALTLPTETERDQQWGKLFESLGHVIHHIQDMAQPEHVRNDLHCGIFWGCGLPGAIVGVYDPSWFELRSKRVFRNGIPVNLVNYPKVAFPTVREFWTTRTSDSVVTDRRGLADFTNRNFVSKDTNFEIRNGIPASSSRYSLPVPSGTNRVDLATLDADGTGICQRLNQNGPVDLPANSPCVVEFIENAVTDSYDPARSGINTRAASLSLFDQYLAKYNVNSVAVEDGDAFHVMDVDRLLTINKYNIDSAHQFLIPRAIAYGAGLIDYFFRHKINLRRDYIDDTWVIENQTSNQLSGDFKLLYEPAGGNRVIVATWSSLTIQPDGESQQLGMPVKPGNSSGYFLLVYMSNDRASMGSVAARKIVIPDITLEPLNGPQLTRQDTSCGYMETSSYTPSYVIRATYNGKLYERIVQGPLATRIAEFTSDQLCPGSVGLYASILTTTYSNWGRAGCVDNLKGYPGCYSNVLNGTYINRQTYAFSSFPAVRYTDDTVSTSYDIGINAEINGLLSEIEADFTP